MTIVKVKNKNEIEGFVNVENWADPKVYLTDFQVAENGFDKDGEKIFAGDLWPEEKENLKYIGVEKF